MPTPVRLQLSRRKGFNLQEHSRAINGLLAVNCARPGKWGNRWKIGATNRRCVNGHETITIESADQAVKYFREDYGETLANPHAGPVLREVLKDLRGKNLACWCGLDQPCHADVLLELANPKGEIE